MFKSKRIWKCLKQLFVSEHCNSEPFFLTEISPFTTCLEGFTVIHNYVQSGHRCNHKKHKNDLLLPKSLAYNKIQAQQQQQQGDVLSMQLDCLTAGSSPSKLSDHYIVPNTISLCPLHSISSFSRHFIPLHVAVPHRSEVPPVS